MISNKMTQKFDILVWGATSSVGRLVVEYLQRHAPKDLLWAIGGRDRKKLESLGANVPILIGDAHDEKALDDIVKQVKVVATTVGPYSLYGKKLVAACARNGVDYCDLTGEVLFIREMIEKHHEEAIGSSARIVHCCGFDSIPSDLGVLMMQRYRPCSEIKYFVLGMKGGLGGGTAASALQQFEDAKAPEARRHLLNPYSLCLDQKASGPDSYDSLDARFDPDLGAWTGPFVMGPVNTRIVRRSNALAGYPYGKDFRYSEVVAFPKGPKGRLSAQALSILMKVTFGLLTAKPVRNVVAKMLPPPGTGPSAQVRESGFFKILLIGKTADGAATIRATIAGQSDPGHGETAKMFAESAMYLAKTKGQGAGGVLTPAVAMGEPLIECLRAAGMTFTIEKS